MTSTTLSPEQMESLFPFMLVIDEHRFLLQISAGLRRLAPSMALGDLISDHLTLVRPAIDWFDESLATKTASSFTVHITGRDAPPLKGQLVVSGNGEVLQLFLRPTIASSETLFTCGLSVRDFALHDPLVDHLFLLQAQETSMRELRTLAATVESERAVLNGANLELGLLYGISDVLGRAISIEEATAPIIDEICRVLDGASALCWAKAPASSEWLRSQGTSEAWTEKLPTLYEPTGTSSLAMAGTVTLMAPLQESDAFEAAALESEYRFATCIPFGAERAQFVLQFFSKTDRLAFDALQALRIVAGRLSDFLATQQRREHERAKTRKHVQQLTHAVLSATEKNRQKTEYLAHVSHDIRTPMNAILGMAELLLGTDLDPKQADYAGIVRDSTRGLLGVINGSLDLARIEAGRLQLASKAFDLYHLVENCAYLFAQQAHAKGVAMTWQISPEVPRGVRGDSERLQQIIANLLGNAIKFTAKGTVTLSIGLVNLEESECRLSIVVRDTGPGIPLHELEEVLEPFTQSETGGREGSGLGLAIVNAFANLMHSEVDLTSKVGVGTTVSIQPLLLTDSDAHVWRPPSALRNFPLTLVGELDSMVYRQLVHLGCRPIVMSAFKTSRTPHCEGDWVLVDLSEETAARTELAQSLTDQIVITVGGEELSGLPHVIGWPPRQRALAERLSVERFESLPTDRLPQLGGRVLIVDDSPLNRRLLAEFLTLWGLDYDEAQDGAVALSMWEKNHYKLIIMDCQMPILDGLAATSEIRKRERAGEHIPVLALTAHAMASDAEKCIAAGMDDYLSKPLTPDILRGKITQLIFDGQRVEERANAMTPEPEAEIETVDEVVWSSLVDLQSRSGGDLLEELVEMYESQGKKLTMEIRAAVESSELVVLRPCAHRLKGTASSIGAARVAAICRVLEELEEPSLALCDELEVAVAEAHRTLVARYSEWVKRSETTLDALPCAPPSE